MFGVLAIDKPAGMTSRDVVNRIQRLIRPIKVGHTGTLDPMATGVLLVAIGRATRLVEFSHEMPKSYEADFILGRRSDTLDVQGQVIELQTPQIPTITELTAAARPWIGRVEQIPPNYSAKNVNGRRAYDLVRSGKKFELEARCIEIHGIDIIRYKYPDVTMAIRCGTGTYVRSLGSDIAQAVETDAVMSRLVRTAIGSTTLADCFPLAELSTLEAVQNSLRPAQTLLGRMPSVQLTEQGCKSIRNGIAISNKEFLASIDVLCDQIAAFDSNQQLVAVLKHHDSGVYRSLRVFMQP